MFFFRRRRERDRGTPFPRKCRG